MQAMTMDQTAREYRWQKFFAVVPMHHGHRRERWARMAPERLRRLLRRWLAGKLAAMYPGAVMAEYVTLSGNEMGLDQHGVFYVISPAVRDVEPRHREAVARWLNAGQPPNGDVLHVQDWTEAP